MDLSPTFYRLPKPLLVHDSMLLLSTLILSSYSIIVVMLGWDLIEVATKCIGSIDYWESLTNRIHGSFSSRSTMRVLVDP